MRSIKFLCIAWFGLNLLACQSAVKNENSTFIFQVQPDSLQTVYPEAEALRPDTIVSSDPIRVYGMAIQRYAAALFFVHEKDAKKPHALSGIQILDGQGSPTQLSISQEQRDSVIMDFLKFARRSSIPYHKTVKDFEMKILAIR